MSELDWIKSNYGVPAKRGVRIEYTGNPSGPKLGTVTGASHGHVLIRLDGEKHSNPYHPTWELRYLGKPEGVAP